MSYILDALKKSDQERQRGATPTLQTIQSLEARREPPRRWPYPALAIVLASAAFAIGWLRPWPTEPAVVARVGDVAPSPLVAPREAPPSITPQVEQALPSPPAAAAGADASRAPHDGSPAAAPAREPANVAAAERARPAPPAPEPPAAVRVPQAAAPAANQQRRTADPGAADAKDNKDKRENKGAGDQVPALSELPATMRAELPSMTVTVHAYSPAPKDRLLGVNNKLLREGDALTPDLVLERITPDGMIFSYKGTRFVRGLR